ncbi:MAG: carboxypeptidase-like regulatory domain-containing protein [Candidatus Solibacter sp.]
MLTTAIVNGAPVMVATNQPPAGGAPPESEVPTYYPSETNEFKAAPVEVKAGDELRGVDILMRRAQTFSVRGTLVMPAGMPQGSIALTMSPKGAQNNFAASYRTAAGPGGSFEFRGVSPGTYVISGRLQALFGRREVAVTAANVEGVSVTMSPAVAVAGLIKMDGAVPAVWPSVTLASEDGSFNGTLRPGADGKFPAPATLPPMDYAIQLGALPAGVYLKSMRFGNQDVLRGKLDLSTGSGALEIVLSRNAAVLTGKVTDTAGVSMQGVQIAAWPRNADQGGPVHLANIDQDGNFSIADFAPGDYWAAAWEALPAALSIDPGFLGRFQSSAAALHLEEGERTKADLKVIPRQKSEAEASRLP